MYNRVTYFISEDARNKLPMALYAHRETNVSERLVLEFDGRVSLRTKLNYTGNHHLSHTLNTYAAAFSLDQWQDNRPPDIKQQHNFQLEPPPPFTSIQQAESYRQTNGLDTYKCLWSKHYKNDTDDNDEPIFRHPVELRLSPSAQDYYYKLALYHKMQVLSRRNRPSQRGYISAVLEAIGHQLLLPPKEAADLIKKSKNTNMGPKSSSRIHIRDLSAKHAWQTDPVIPTALTKPVYASITKTNTWYLTPYLSYPDTVTLAELFLKEPVFCYVPNNNASLRDPQPMQMSYRSLVVDKLVELAHIHNIEPQGNLPPNTYGVAITAQRERNYAAAALESIIRGELTIVNQTT